MPIEYTIDIKYILTRRVDGEATTIHKYDDPDEAYNAGHALAFQEREELGYPPGDDRVTFADRHRDKEPA